MRVLYVSKASVVPAYQDKLSALAEHVDLEAVIPARWGAERATAVAAGAARVRIEPALFHGHNHLHVYRAARDAVRSAAPDLVHIDEEPHSAATFQFARICADAGIPFLFFAWQNLDKRIPPPFASMRRYVFATAAAGIAGTERAARVLTRGGFAGRLAVIPQLGVNPDRFRPDASERRAVRERCGLPQDALVAGFAGRLVPEKGVDMLIDAAALVPQVHLLVIGDGPERTRLERRAAALCVASRTRFAGRVDSLDMPSWLNALDVLVLPSRATRGWVEQFGRVLIEAMACGVPVLGSATGEIPAVVGEAGLTFPENDRVGLAARVAELCASPARRAVLASVGRQRVLERFTQRRIARDTANLYESVLAPERTGATV